MSISNQFSPAPAGETQMPAYETAYYGAEEEAVDAGRETSLDSRLYRHVRAILCLSLASGICATSAGFLVGLGSPWMLPLIFFMAAAFALGMARGAGDNILSELEYHKQEIESKLIISRLEYLELYSDYMALRRGEKWAAGPAAGFNSGVSPAADVISIASRRDR